MKNKEKARQVSDSELAEAFIAGLGKVGRLFFQEQQGKHNRSLFSPSGRLSRGTATRAAQAQESRSINFAELHGWVRPERGVRPHR